MVNSFLADIRLALRAMKRRKAQSLLLLVTLGLGLGANVAMFGIVDAMILRPLDFPNLDRLVRIWETHPNNDSFDQWTVAPANFLDWEAQTGDVFEALVAVEYWQANLRGSDTPERAQGFKVSPGFFDSLGIRPVLGRGFLPGDSRPGEVPRLVLGAGVWERSFASDPGIVGRTVMVDGQGHTVVGVAPRGFMFPEGAEMWSPLPDELPGVAARDKHYLSVIGWLKPGVSIERVRAQMDAVSQRLATENPLTNKTRRARVETLARGFEDSGMRPILGFFELGAALVLLIACVNVANFLLARGAERHREVAVRQALGAGHSRIMRQLMTEGLLTGLLSLVVAFPVAAVATRAVREMLPTEIARFLNGWSSIDLDGRAVLFGASLAVLSSVFFSLVPARRISRPRISEALKEGGRANTEGAVRQNGRNLLVVVQIASALALVLVASLATRSAWILIDGPQGYDPDNLLALEVSLPDTTYSEPESRRIFSREVEARLTGLPGVSSVAYANILPARNSNNSRTVRIEGATAMPDSELPVADSRAVSPNYFQTMGIPILSGRALNERDDASEGSPQVAVVSRSFANRYWPGQDPLGRRFRAGDAAGATLTVVGVSGDVIHQWFARRNYPTFYRPYAQDPTPGVTFAMRASGAVEALARDAKEAMAQVDPYQPAFGISSMRRSIATTTVGLRFVAGIMSSLSVLALLLALSGIYGVMTFRVSLRTMEIGVRRVLGATSADILRLTMAQAGWLTLVGLMVGAGLGVAGGQALSSALQGAVAVDVPTVTGLSALLALSALTAAYIPARRSLAVDPAHALRAE